MNDEAKTKRMRMDYLKTIFQERNQLGRAICKIEAQAFSLKSWEEKCKLIARDRFLKVEMNTMFGLI